MRNEKPINSYDKNGLQAAWGAISHRILVLEKRIDSHPVFFIAQLGKEDEQEPPNRDNNISLFVMPSAHSQAIVNNDPIALYGEPSEHCPQVEVSANLPIVKPFLEPYFGSDMIFAHSTTPTHLLRIITLMRLVTGQNMAMKRKTKDSC